MAMRGLLTALISLCLVAGAAAQEPPAGQTAAERLKTFTQEQQQEQQAQAEGQQAASGEDANFEGPRLPTSQTLTALERLTTLSPDVADSYLTALKAQYDYKTQGFGHRSKVFAWQYYSSIVIFGMVVMLVAAGFYFSWVQFRRDLMVPGTGGESTELELSAQGIKIQSSILGVIILVVSLAFLYLYLVYVYPISEIL